MLCLKMSHSYYCTVAIILGALLLCMLWKEWIGTMRQSKMLGLNWLQQTNEGYSSQVCHFLTVLMGGAKGQCVYLYWVIYWDDSHSWWHHKRAITVWIYKQNLYSVSKSAFILLGCRENLNIAQYCDVPYLTPSKLEGWCCSLLTKRVVESDISWWNGGDPNHVWTTSNTHLVGNIGGG